MRGMSDRPFSGAFRRLPSLVLYLFAAGIVPAAVPPVPQAAPARLPAWPEKTLVLVDLAEAKGRSPITDEALVRAAGVSPGGVEAVVVDYPRPGTLFPPDMVAPTFLFHDKSGGARLWLVELSAAGRGPKIYVLTDGRRPERPFDPRCGTPGDLYQEPEYQASAKGWTPDPGLWAMVTSLPEAGMTASIYGIAGPSGGAAGEGRPAVLSRGAVSFRISRDPVGAPIFYRDVPLIPTRNEKGVVMPLAEGSLPLIEWRLRDLAKPESALVLKNMPTCANCHSFSNDGRYLGMDMDGPSGDKGSYALAEISPRMVISNDQVFSWTRYDPKQVTFGMFSRVSPDGRYVVSSVNESIFVVNYLDFRFLQTFYPTRAILAIYDREAKTIKALPGADDPRFVHCNAVWAPDGKSLVFLRAQAVDNKLKGPPPVRANDPNELQIRYDLYRMPFNEGRGGTAEPLPGGSANGRSNSFPKISPDGRWLVWVEAANGLLMRPDSELYIMPAAGGTPRRMSCNLSLMNSWHSFSPNGRWLVFVSKADTPYTQMYLTHIDEEGRDTPAVLVPNSTASNRVVNLPEFVAVPPGGLVSIDAPAVDYRRHLDRAADLVKAGRLDEAFPELKTADAMRPGFADTLAAFGYYYREKGDTARAVDYFEKALAADPRNWAAHNFYGVTLFRAGRYDEAMAHLAAAVEVNPLNAQSLTNLGTLEFTRGNIEAARASFEKALDSTPRYAKAHFNLAMLLARGKDFRGAADHYEKAVELAPSDGAALANLAWLYATCADPAVRNGGRALELGRSYLKLAGEANPRAQDILGAALAETGRFEEAREAARKALRLSKSDDPARDTRLRLLALYEAGKAFHGQFLP